MFYNLLEKMFRLPSTFRIRISPILNRLFLKGKGVRYGRNLQVIGRLDIRGEGSVAIGDNFCFVSGESVNPICSNLHRCFYTAHPDARIVIGDNVGMSSTRIWVSRSLSVGDHVKIGGMVLIMDTDVHPMDAHARRTTSEGTVSAPIVIEDDVWIGAHSIILKGVTIGARTVIGAGSVVTKSIPADCVAAGNPCRVIRSRNASVGPKG